MPLRSKTTGQSKAFKKKPHNLLCSVGQHRKAVWEPHNDNDQTTFNFVCCARKTHNLKGFCADRPSLPGEEPILPRQHSSHHSANVLLETCPRKTAQVLRMFKG